MKKQTTSDYSFSRPNPVKKILCALLSSVLLFSSAVLTAIPTSAETVTQMKITDYIQGAIVEFGSYPQSEVKDAALKTTLTGLAGNTSTWTSYGYFSGTGNANDGKMTRSYYMSYKDVEYGNNKYRGVYFTKYRPYATYYTASETATSQSYQHKNGYYVNNIYWFKYEPIQWRVLDPATGLVMSETILDAQMYNNYVLWQPLSEPPYGYYWGNIEKTYYPNNYKYSNIRA